MIIILVKNLKLLCNSIKKILKILLILNNKILLNKNIIKMNKKVLNIIIINLLLMIVMINKY